MHTEEIRVAALEAAARFCAEKAYTSTQVLDIAKRFEKYILRGS